MARSIEDAGIGASTATAEHHGLGQIFGTCNLLLQILVFRIVAMHVLIHRLRLVELALALEIERQVVQVVHQWRIKRHLAKLVECHVELALSLERQTKHAIRFRRLDIRFLLAGLSHNEALGRQQQVPNQQQGGRHHQLDPHPGRGHQRKMGEHQRGQNAQRNQPRRFRFEPRQQTDQVRRHQEKYQ